MESPRLSTPADTKSQTAHSHSATSSDTTSSPSLSFFSKNYSARTGSSASSLASSPAPRESQDGFGPGKTILEDVTEEPQERDSGYGTHDTSYPHYFRMSEKSPNPHEVLLIREPVDDVQQAFFSSPRPSFDHMSLHSPSENDYSFDDRGVDAETLSNRPSHKRQRGTDSSLPGVTSRLGTRFPSLSKRWKNKSGAGPKLSIVTHADHSGSRASSANSSQLLSPALSAISKHENHLPPSPAHTSFEEAVNDACTAPTDIEQPPQEQMETQTQATTPLLPPMMMTYATSSAPVCSPLQCPSTAGSPVFPAPTTPQVHDLPSPPLSTKPSLVSMRARSRAGTLTAPAADVPPMQMLNETEDEWSRRLGHANFEIEPQPYLPEVKSIQSYRELRADWDLARCNYAKQLARTGEHWGTTSTTYRLTEEKWASIDAEWKKHDSTMAGLLQPLLTSLTDEDFEQYKSSTSNSVLEKPVTRVMVPHIGDSNGKFPEMGDQDIVGPMAVAPRRFEHANVESTFFTQRTRKRSFLRFFSDILTKGHTARQ